MREMTLRIIVLLLLSLSAATPARAQELVIVLEGSKEYHRPGCERIQGRTDVLAMQRGQAESKGFKAHPECDPARVPPGSAPAKVIMVTVDDGAKYYHRDKCGKIGKSPRKVSVEEASKKHWPCPACKPPIRPRKKPDGST
jgi:hypothetical protein